MITNASNFLLSCHGSSFGVSGINVIALAASFRGMFQLFKIQPSVKHHTQILNIGLTGDDEFPIVKSIVSTFF